MERRKIKDLIADNAILEVQDGNHGEKHPTSADYVEEGIPFLMARDFQEGRVNLQGACKIPKPLGDSLRIGFARSGDVLLTHKGTVGLVAIVPNVSDYVMLTPQVTYYRTNPKKLLNKYLKYAFQAPFFRDQLSSFSAQSTRPYIGITAQKGLQLDFPSLPIQRRIAGILSAYDDLIENSQRRIKILESMARALYREWFVHFRFPGHENHPRVASPLGEIPEGWEVRNVKDIATVTYGFPFASKRFNTNGIGSPVIRIRDIPDGVSATFTDEDAEPKYNISDGHILVGMDGDFHMCIWSSGHALQNQRVARFESSGEIGNLHLFLALEKPIREFNKAIVGTTVAHLGDMHIKMIQLVWPPASLRAKARDVLEPMSEQVIDLKKKIQNLRRIRDLLLPRLLSGQIALDELEAA
jgi:type I restriction enzyme, S subunit